ncbi:hypothetical protein [Sphingomonas sp. LM7]|uniref:hypothetical protein n=1 Tax=Sphingomonas sp. LM7 TaxID=1938607 RepID=UPI000984045D|nr:hypothetical protein [Sphingomonas sp. LM7]AQR73721.1 hypothetical protein BXU08_08760 [Sphingomonas sp. LM7]
MHDIFKISMAAVALACLVPGSGVQAQTRPPIVYIPSNGQTIVRDGSIEIRYRFGKDSIQFSSELPAGWSFSVAVDGDQNGVWGYGPRQSSDELQSPDFKIGQDTRGSVFCGQYIFTAMQSDPNKIYSSSDCDAFVMGGFVKLGQLKADGNAELTYEVPMQTMFGQRDSARLQICVWDTKRENCYFPMPNLFVIKRP